MRAKSAIEGSPHSGLLDNRERVAPAKGVERSGQRVDAPIRYSFVCEFAAVHSPNHTMRTVRRADAGVHKPLGDGIPRDAIQRS